MKKFTFLFSMIIATTVAFGNGNKTTHPVHVLSARMSIVHLKLNREFVGATLEIYNEAGDLISSQIVTERKVLIDFDSQKEGIYKIKVKKGTDEDVMNYINAESSFNENENPEAITIIQGI
jgi:hypothetical protein